jgi:hypothetical protein
MPQNRHNLYLYIYIVERGRIKQLGNFDESVLHIFSRDILRRIKENDTSWESMVPEKPELPFRTAVILAASSVRLMKTLPVER